MRHNTQYLFGINPSELENKFYFEALQYKIDAAKKLHRCLYELRNPTPCELDRKFYVIKALRHTERLMEDRYEKD